MSEALLADLLALAALPAPTFDERERIDWLTTRLENAPGRREVDRTGNLIWLLGDARPRIVAAAHVDTVFSRDAHVEPRQVRARLVGPGVGDNAAAVAAVISVCEALASDAAVSTDALAVAFTVGEEGLGNLHGARAACEALRPERLLAVEGHGLDQVFVDAVGSVRFSIELRGPGGHSWSDRGRASAVHELLRLGGRLLAASTAEAPVNVGIVEGGEAVNGIAAHASMLVEARSLDGAALEAFRREVGQLTAETSIGVEIEERGFRPAGRLSPDDPLLAIVRAVRSELGLPDELAAASTDANAALALGIPALAIGVSRGSDMHTVDESIDLESLELGRRYLQLVLGRALADSSG